MGEATIPYPTLLARFTPQSPIPFWKGQATALAAVAAAIGLRWALEPVLGDEVSFTTLFPAVLMSTLLAGAPGACTTVIGGAVASLALSALGDPTPQVVRDAAPRLVVWLLVGSLVAGMALALRATIVALRRRQIELAEARDRQAVLTRELEHRGRNALTIVQALSAMTARSADSVETYRRELSHRIVALSRGYSMLLREPDKPQPLDALVHEVLVGFGDQVRFSGASDVLVSPKMCVSLALALHELATNAVKYGALSCPVGRVDINWTREAGGSLRLHWREVGGPGPPEMRSGGVGTQVIRQAFIGVPDAHPQFSIGPDGVRFEVRLPTQRSPVPSAS